MAKLNQVIAIEKSVKNRAHNSATALNKAVQRKELFEGFSKKFTPVEDSSAEFPPENKKVQLTAGEALEGLREAYSEHFDITAQKDFANCEARADVKIGATVLIAQAPVPYLLFLEKYLNDIRTLISNIPVLSEDENWDRNDALGLFQGEPVLTQRKEKTQEPIVLYDATPQHPAQTQLVPVDKLVGTWETIKRSGALPKARQKELLTRVNTLAKAVKVAREEANSQEAPEVRVADPVFDYLLG